MRKTVTTAPSGKSVESITLSRGQEGIQVVILTYGATIQQILVPGEQPRDIVLGFDAAEDYFGPHPYFGCAVGRVANRIKGGSFELDGQTVKLSQNRPPNCLHGGFAGWDKQVWEVEKIEADSVTLSYLSKDGEEGFPGNVTARVTYALQGNGELRISYHATTDKPTPINMTNHSYFNLHGQSRSITDHILTLNADSFLVCDENVLPTGEIKNVAGTPFDFTQPAPIGKEPGWFEGVRGYDNCFVLRDAKEGELRLAARVKSPDTNIALEVHTTQPGVQFYSSNFFDGTVKAKASHLTGSASGFYQKQFGLALETQHFPDSPNQPSFPSIIIRPGEVYSHTTLLKIAW